MEKCRSLGAMEVFRKGVSVADIGRLSVAEIETPHVMKVLNPIWLKKPETASRLRGRIEAVLGWAATSGHRKGENPARWKDHLDNLLVAKDKVRTVRHQPSLSYSEVPALMSELRGRNGMAALALEFAVPTCVRSLDVLNAKHADVDRAAKIWTIPASSKTGAEHRVPLSTAALAAFDKARSMAEEIGGRVGRSEFIFPNDVSGGRLSENVSVLNRMGRKGTVTAHGFRASFRTWALECSSFAGN